jgi:uncharacterized protein (DUF2267 family)
VAVRKIDAGDGLSDDESLISTRPPPRGALEFEDFIARVAGRARVKPHEALRASEAVLEALAGRLSGGQVDDIAARVPAAFWPPLTRGKAQSQHAARSLEVEEFLRAAAERERITAEQAWEHARAVLATLREAIGQAEFAAVAAQLPKAYAELLAAA